MRRCITCPYGKLGSNQLGKRDLRCHFYLVDTSTPISGICKISTREYTRQIRIRSEQNATA